MVTTTHVCAPPAHLTKHQCECGQWWIEGETGKPKAVPAFVAGKVADPLPPHKEEPPKWSEVEWVDQGNGYWRKAVSGGNVSGIYRSNQIIGFTTHPQIINRDKIERTTIRTIINRDKIARQSPVIRSFHDHLAVITQRIHEHFNLTSHQERIIEMAYYQHESGKAYLVLKTTGGLRISYGKGRLFDVDTLRYISAWSHNMMPVINADTTLVSIDNKRKAHGYDRIFTVRYKQ